MIKNSLRHIRTTRTALSVRDLAGLLDYKTGTVYAYENGQNTIHPDVAKHIVSTLAKHGVETSLDELYTERPDDMPASTERAA